MRSLNKFYFKGRLIKYSVIDVEDLEEDLLRWKWLYLAGRLQKYVVDLISPNESLLKALNTNRSSALQVSSQWYSQTTRFTLQ